MPRNAMAHTKQVMCWIEFAQAAAVVDKDVKLVQFTRSCDDVNDRSK